LNPQRRKREELTKKTEEIPDAILLFFVTKSGDSIPSVRPSHLNVKALTTTPNVNRTLNLTAIPFFDESHIASATMLNHPDHELRTASGCVVINLLRAVTPSLIFRRFLSVVVIAIWSDARMRGKIGSIKDFFRR
jgi:hypothetical protein